MFNINPNPNSSSQTPLDSKQKYAFSTFKNRLVERPKRRHSPYTRTRVQVTKDLSFVSKSNARVRRECRAEWAETIHKRQQRKTEFNYFWRWLFNEKRGKTNPLYRYSSSLSSFDWIPNHCWNLAGDHTKNAIKFPNHRRVKESMQYKSQFNVQTSEEHPLNLVWSVEFSTSINGFVASWACVCQSTCLSPYKWHVESECVSIWRLFELIVSAAWWQNSIVKFCRIFKPGQRCWNGSVCVLLLFCCCRRF